MVEKRAHHFTPEAKEQPKKWTESGESTPKKEKTVPSTGKAMESHFRDAPGIIYIDYLKKGAIVNSEYYTNLLKRFSDEIKKKRHYAKRKVLFYRDECTSLHIHYRDDLN